MTVFKAIRILIVFAASAVIAFWASVETMFWVFVTRLPHDGKYDDGNSDAMFFFLGVVLGFVLIPIAGGLAVLGVEGLINKWAHMQSATG